MQEKHGAGLHTVPPNYPMQKRLYRMVVPYLFQVQQLSFVAAKQSTSRNILPSECTVSFRFPCPLHLKSQVAIARGQHTAQPASTHNILKSMSAHLHWVVCFAHLQVSMAVGYLHAVVCVYLCCTTISMFESTLRRVGAYQFQCEACHYAKPS